MEGTDDHFCQIDMTEIVMGDVNAVYALEYAHRGHLPTAWVWDERSLLSLSPRHREDFVILSILHFWEVCVESPPIGCHLVDDTQ